MSILKISDVANNILDKFVQDKDLKEQLAHNLKKELIELDKQQIEVNKQAAKSPNWFVAAARPSILWICSLSLAIHYCILPVATWIAVVAGVDLQLEALQFDFTQLTTILMALLGMSSLRSVEKVKGVAR